MKNKYIGGSIASCIPLLLLAADMGGGNGAQTEAETDTPPAPRYDPLQDHPVVETSAVPIKNLVLDAGTQPRVSLSDDVINDYAEVIKEASSAEQPIPFPPVDVFRDATGRLVLARGFHRTLAHKKAGEKEIVADIREGNEHDAFVFSLGANATHGQPRTRRDIDRAVKLALMQPEIATLNNMDIARLCAVSEAKVRTSRKELKDKVGSAPTVKTVTRKGKTMKMNTKSIGKRGKGATPAQRKKAAANASKKSSAAAKGDDAASKAAVELDKGLIKIVEMTGEGKIRKAVHEGSLELTPRDVKDWAGFSPKVAKAIVPLVTGSMRMKPFKAMEFLKAEVKIPAKVETDLHNHAIANGGTLELKRQGFTITVTVTGK